MYRPVPVFGRLASLMGFAMGDPHAFISEAVSSARSARVNSFEMYLGGTRMAVVFEQEHARQVLALPRKLARFYKPEMMVEWMGRYSPLTVDDPAEQERARTLCLKMMPVLTEDPLIEMIKHALARDEHGRARGAVYDLGDALRLAAVAWIIQGIRAGMRISFDHREAWIRTLEWFEAADTFAAVVPWARPLTSWRRQAAARARLVECLGLQDEREQDAALTLLLGAINPSMVALEALAIGRRGLGPHTAEESFSLALVRPPVPLIVREALAPISICSSIVGPGEGIGIAAGPSEYPFGGGPHGCIGGRAAKVMTGALFRAAAQTGLRFAGEVDRGRMHLSHGARSLLVRH